MVFAAGLHFNNNRRTMLQQRHGCGRIVFVSPRVSLDTAVDRSQSMWNIGPSILVVNAKPAKACSTLFPLPKNRKSPRKDDTVFSQNETKQSDLLLDHCSNSFFPRTAF